MKYKHCVLDQMPNLRNWTCKTPLKDSGLMLLQKHKYS